MYSRVAYCLQRFKELTPFRLILMQFKKGSKEVDYLHILSQLKCNEVMTDLLFKDRLFASLSNYAVCQEDTKWTEVEAKARIQLQKVDMRVDSG